MNPTLLNAIKPTGSTKSASKASILKQLAGYSGGGVLGSAFYDQLQGHDIPTSLDDISKQRALNFLFNAALVGGGSKMLRSGLTGAGNTTQALAGSATVFSPPFKDLALAATKPVMKLSDTMDSLKDNRTSKFLAGGALGLGTLGLGMYGLSKYKDHVKDEEGNIEIALPTRDPNDTETVVRMPMSQVNMSKSMRDNIERDMRRRLRAGGSERTKKRDPQTGDLISKFEYQQKYAASTPPGSITPAPPPPPNAPAAGAMLPASVRQPAPVVDAEVPQVDPALEAAQTEAAQAAQAIQSATMEREHLKLENEKLKAKAEVAAGVPEIPSAELSPALKAQASRAMKAVGGVKMGSSSVFLLAHAIAEVYSTKRAHFKSASARVPSSLGNSPAVAAAEGVKPKVNKITKQVGPNSMAQPATARNAGGDSKGYLPYNRADYANLTESQKAEQSAALTKYHRAQMVEPNWFDNMTNRAGRGENIFGVTEDASGFARGAGAVGDFLIGTPVRGYTQAADAYGRADAAQSRGEEIGARYDGYKGPGAKLWSDLTNRIEGRNEFKAYQEEMDAANALTGFQGRLGKLKAQATGGLTAAGAAASVIPATRLASGLGTTARVGLSASGMVPGMLFSKGGVNPNDISDSAARDYFSQAGSGRPDMLMPRQGGGYSNYALNNMNGNPYHNAFSGASNYGGNGWLNAGVNQILPTVMGYAGQNPSWNNTMSGMYSGGSPQRNQMMQALNSGINLGGGSFNQKLWPAAV